MLWTGRNIGGWGKTKEKKIFKKIIDIVSYMPKIWVSHERLKFVLGHNAHLNVCELTSMCPPKMCDW